MKYFLFPFLRIAFLIANTFVVLFTFLTLLAFYFIKYLNIATTPCWIDKPKPKKKYKSYLDIR